MHVNLFGKPVQRTECTRQTFTCSKSMILTIQKKSEICLNLTSSRDGTGSIVAEKKLDSSFHETQFLLEGMRKSYIKDASAKKVAY